MKPKELVERLVNAVYDSASFKFSEDMKGREPYITANGASYGKVCNFFMELQGSPPRMPIMILGLDQDEYAEVFVNGTKLPRGSATKREVLKAVNQYVDERHT